MWTSLTVHLLFVFIVFLSSGNRLSLVSATANVPRVTSLTPKEGGTNGGTRITINGENFAETLFTLGNEDDVGNKVILTNLEPYDCTIHPDGTHLTQITCYTKPMPVGTYKIKVSVDGIDILDDNICNDCTFKVKAGTTPTITSVEPPSGLPGSVITLSGDIITDKYGSNLPDETQAKILRVFFGGQKCELRETVDEMYGLVYDPDTKKGYMKCKTEGTHIGNQVISYLVSNEHGRSEEDGKTLYPRSNGISMYQTFTEMTNMSLNEGSTAGGTLIEIEGKHFDETNMDAKVDIAGSECVITEKVTDSKIMCMTAEDPTQGMEHFTGGRGWYAYVVSGIVDFDTINKKETPAEHLDTSEWRGYNISDHTVLVTGYFVPVTAGSYSLCHRSSSRAKVFISTDGDPANMTLASDGTDTCNTFEHHSLDKGQRCYIEVQYSSSAMDSYVTVIGHLKETTYSESDTKWAQHEQQRFTISSNTSPEIQKVEVASPGEYDLTPDIQEIIIDGDTSSKFVIGLDGIYTTEFSLPTLTDEALEKQLNKLPTIVGDIEVAVTGSDTNKVVTITSKFEHGIVGDYEGMLLSGSPGSLTFNHSRTQTGASASDHFALTMDGISTKPLEIGSSANQVENSLLDIFSVQCHPVLNEGTLQKFESRVGWMRDVVSYTEPFCDRYSIRNPYVIFKEVAKSKLRLSASNNRYFCFAYKGPGGLNRIVVYYENTDDKGDSKNHRVAISINNPNEDLEVWNYWCEDIYDILRTQTPGTLQVVKNIAAIRQHSGLDFYMDHAAFRKDMPISSDLLGKISIWRKPQLQPKEFFIDDVAVSKSGDTYDIKLKPHFCGNGFDLFETLHGNVSRVQEASIPIVGSYKILFKDGATEEIPVTAMTDEDGVAAQLGAMTVGYSEVSGSGTCSGFRYDIKMVSQTGDQPDVSIDSSKLKGDNVKTTVKILQNGGLWLSPIMGDLLRSHHTKPQVTTYINGIATRCADKAVCDFDWTENATPNVTSVSPTKGSDGEIVTIQGSGLGDCEVMFGETPCEVTSNSSTEIVCTAGDGPNGESPVKVYVKGKGLASGDATFTFIFEAAAVSGMTGSLEGGTRLSIPGYGFASDIGVEIGGNMCTITKLNSSHIECLTPRADTLSTTDVKIALVLNGSEEAIGDFTYSTANTPIISSVNVSTSSASGGAIIAIEGTDFGDVEMPVMLGDKEMEVLSYEDTEIIAVLPPMKHGSYKILVHVEGKGYADLRTNSIKDMTYVFQVTGMTPDFGSVYGGTDLTIEGLGFEESHLRIRVGQHECKLLSVNASSASCRIVHTGIEHRVFANGTHSHYGKNYAWDKDPVTVSVGDTVRWEWETPFYVRDMAYSVRQTARANDMVDMVDGFTSGAKSREGAFSHTFTEAGTFYHWTNFMDSSDVIYFRGSVIVLPVESTVESLSVEMLGIEANYQTTGGPEATPSFSCAVTTSNLTDCVDDAVLEGEAKKFTFRFSKCHSPSFSNLSLTDSTFYKVITLAGDGFGLEDCQNVVSYGEKQMNKDGCTEVVNSSVSSVDFKITPACEPPTTELHKFQVRVNNLGYALMALPPSSSMFALVPLVEGIEPASGSKVGGTKVTIAGAGFTGDKDNVIVEFELNRLSCEIESRNYTHIICTTDCKSQPDSCFVGQMSFQVWVGSVPAECDGSACLYNTSEAETPTVTSVSPNSVSESVSKIEIVGSNFLSEVSAFIGDNPCSVKEVNETYFVCEKVGRLPVGDNEVRVYFPPVGKAATTEVVTSEKVAAITSPSESSTNGGATLVIDGNGFVDGDTSVLVNDEECTNETVTLAQVTCTLPPQAVGTHTVVITSNGQTYSSLDLDYTSDVTPKVESVSPESGANTDTLVIAGAGFDSPDGSDPTVTIGGVECNVTASTNTSITCTAGVQSTGEFPVQVLVPEKGLSNSNVKFTYELSPFTLSPVEGSTNGGQLLTLSGSGFLEGETEVTICGSICELVSVTSAEVVCKTAAHEAASCYVAAEVQGAVHNESSAYSYDDSLVSEVTDVSPSRGGTGGGVSIIITGTNFGTTVGDIQVMIEDSACTVKSVTNTRIECKSGPSKKSVVTKVEVQRSGWGLALQTKADFEYIDVWSSIFTWGGTSLPEDGDFIIIKEGQKILLDTDTPVLSMLLIQGGYLVFDEKDVELQSEYILITDGGILEVGTEDKPFEHKAIITLHGHVRSKELPVYGAKGIGLREGRLELHGRHIPIPWTYLNATAAADSYTLNLEHEVNWNVGDEVIIATTGDRLSQKESEVRTIETISADKMQVSLTEKLTYEHISISDTFGSHTVEFKGEVGLLTRNVVVRGHRNVEFDHKVEACPDDFNPGEFSTQTCFQGRFGEEVGSDQYGVHILIHQQDKDTQVAQAHIENVEITHAGQAFRLGRYPVHFHLNGNMSESYVRRCAIHDTFNRAVNIHGSHHTIVEHNVVYNVMGGALFLEDGNEVGNTFQYNLEILIKSSTSLLNDDITPAALWVTNPNNIIRHNAAAGGTHFGAWYRMRSHPEGPGFTKTICPQNVHLGEYSNNTAHSLGWFGLWIFETYIPKDGDICSDSAPHKVAKFYSLTAWNNNEGAEAVNAGAIQFHDFVVVNNQKSSIHFSLIRGKPPQYDPDNGPGVFNAVIVARHSGLRGLSSGQGIVQPHFNGFMMKDIEFYNFDQDRSNALTWVTIAGTCTEKCGGFTTAVSGVSFHNSPNKVRFAWENEGVIKDFDGSLTGEKDASVVACSGSFPPSKCNETEEFSRGVKGCICSSDVNFVRFAFNEIRPTSLNYKTAHFKSEHGITYGPWQQKRISHFMGWQVVLVSNTSYEMTFEDAEHMVNISYKGAFYRVPDGDYIIFTQNAYQMPDLFKLDGSTNLPVHNKVPEEIDVQHGQWFYNDSKLTYAVKNEDDKDEIPIKMEATRCFFRGCQKPESPMSIVKQPANAERTSVPDTWDGLTTHGTPAKPGDDLYVANDRWIVVDTVLPKLGKVVIEGGLEFAEDFLTENLLEADHIYITGRLVAGWSEEKPFNGKLTIRLRGNHSSPYYTVTDGPNLGAKFIAVFGGLELHGKPRDDGQTYLASEANKGDSSIEVKDAVDWQAGEEILITTTDYDAWHTETFTITSVSDKTITLDGTIQHRHISHQETINNEVVELSAKVALLSRNIRVEGADYGDLVTESFGARIIVGQTFANDEMFSGFAKVSNVEFYHSGQEGFTSPYDARYALTYMGVTSTEGNVRYSYAKHNTFHHGFSPAIGVYNTDGLEIEGNVIHHTVGPGIVIAATGAKVRGNLVTLSIWPGGYLDRKETENYDFSGGIEARKANDLILENNVVAGAERIAFGLPGQACGTADKDLWSGNMAVGALAGVALFVANSPGDATCVQYSGFTLWKNFDYGIYYNNKPSLVIKGNTFIENSLGINPFVVGPAAASHAYADKTVTIADNVFVGKTTSFSETLDVMPDRKSVSMSSQARGGANGVCGKIGILSGTFTSGSNEAPRKTWLNIMSYQAINGITKIRGNHFMNYGACTGGYDHVIGTNKLNDDVIHPMLVSESTVTNVIKEAKILFHEPNVGKINPSDCVDMDCDAHKKSLLTDTDGTFFPKPTTVLPEAAFEWDGDRKHGLGDYRIPTPMITTHDGKKLDPQVLAPHKGLYKIDECEWIEAWRAYECTNGLHWRMLVAESMDKDTELRRISPIAVWNKEGYVDLINGPQDHGWCSGYTCQKRLSTFPILVPLAKPTEMFLTSTNPRKMRYMLLNSEPTDCVRLSMWYNVINRLEVTVDGVAVIPNNGFYDKNERYRVKMESFEGEFMPNANSTKNGENYIDQEKQIITWITCGGAEVVVTRLDALLVSFTLPEMTVDDFFGENLVENLAAFLGIDPKKVRVVNVVTASGDEKRRRKRSGGTSTIYIEISDSPDETPSTDITEVSEQIVTLVQFGDVSEVLEVEVLYTAMVEPDSENDEAVILQRPGALVLETPPEGDVSEDAPLSVQPRLKVTDVDGNVVTHLGSSTLIWEIEASIKSGGLPRSSVVGTTRMNFTNGWANFTELAIDDMGDDYIIEFRIVYPPEAENYTIDSPTLNIYGKQFRPKATLLTTPRVTDTPIKLEVGLVDKSTDLDFTDIGWDGHTWQAAAEIYDTTVYSGDLMGDSSIGFDAGTGVATLSFLLTKPGTCPLLVTITSDPAGYTLKMVVDVDLVTPDQNSFVVEENHDIEFLFPITYDEVRAPYWANQVANQYSAMSGLRITNVAHRSGSTYVTLTVEASASGYNDTVSAMCADIESGTSFTFDGTAVAMAPHLNIDGDSYYGVSCGPLPPTDKRKDDDGDGLDMKYIIIIAVLAVVILILIIALIYKCHVQPKAKTNVLSTTSTTPVSGQYYKDNDLLADVLLREETSSSFKSWTTGTKPPAATIHPHRGFSSEVDPVHHRTPSPAWAAK